MRQNYSQKYLQEISYKYNLGLIKRFFLFTSGFENSNYLIETAKGKYVIKIFEGNEVGANNILFELKVINQCLKGEIKTPRLLKNNKKESSVTLNGKTAIIMDFIDGKNMDRKQINDGVAYSVGQETGKMDAVMSNFKDGRNTRQNYEWDLKNFLILKNKVKYLDKNFDKNLIHEIFTKYRKIKPIFDSMPTGLIHNDIGLHNILVKNGKLKAIIDFSDMAFSPYIQNFSIPMSQMFFCYNWKPKQAGLFIKGYKEQRSITNEELSLLYDLTRARFATSVIEFNYWNKKLFGEDRQRTEAIEDSYKFLIKFTKLGKDKFDQLLKI